MRAALINANIALSCDRAKERVLDFFGEQNFKDLVQALDDGKFGDMPPLVPLAAVKAEKSTRSAGSPHSEEGKAPLSATSTQKKLTEALGEDQNLTGPSHCQKVDPSYPKVDLHELLRRRMRRMMSGMVPIRPQSHYPFHKLNQEDLDEPIPQGAAWKMVLETDIESAPVGAINGRVLQKMDFERHIPGNGRVYEEVTGKQVLGADEEAASGGAVTGKLDEDPWFPEVPEKADFEKAIPSNGKVYEGATGKNVEESGKEPFDDSYEEFEEARTGPWFPDPEEIPAGIPAVPMGKDSFGKVGATGPLIPDPDDLPLGNGKVLPEATSASSEKDTLVATKIGFGSEKDHVVVENEQDEKFKECATGPWFPDPDEVPHSNDKVAATVADSEKDSLGGEIEKVEKKATEKMVLGSEKESASKVYETTTEPPGNEKVKVKALIAAGPDSEKDLVVVENGKIEGGASVPEARHSVEKDETLADEGKEGSEKAGAVGGEEDQSDSTASRLHGKDPVVEGGKVSAPVGAIIGMEEESSLVEQSRIVEESEDEFEEATTPWFPDHDEVPIDNARLLEATAAGSGKDSLGEEYGKVEEKATETVVLESEAELAPLGAFNQEDEVGATDEIPHEKQVVAAPAVLPERDSRGKEQENVVEADEEVEEGATGPWFPDPDEIPFGNENDLAKSTVAGSEKDSLIDITPNSGEDSPGEESGKVKGKATEKQVLESDKESVPDGGNDEKVEEGGKDSLGEENGKGKGAKEEVAEGATGLWFPDPDGVSLASEESLAEATASGSKGDALGKEKGKAEKVPPQVPPSTGKGATPADKGRKQSQKHWAAGGEKDKEHYDPSDSLAQFYKCLMGCTSMAIEEAGLPQSPDTYKNVAFSLFSNILNGGEGLSPADADQELGARTPKKRVEVADQNAQVKAEFARMTTVLGPQVIHPQVIWHQTLFYVEFRVSSERFARRPLITSVPCRPLQITVPQDKFEYEAHLIRDQLMFRAAVEGSPEVYQFILNLNYQLEAFCHFMRGPRVYIRVEKAVAAIYPFDFSGNPCVRVNHEEAIRQEELCQERRNEVNRYLDSIVLRKKFEEELAEEADDFDEDSCTEGVEKPSDDDRFSD